MRRAGKPEVDAVGSELEAARIDVKRSEAGEKVAEAPDRTVLGRVLVSGLDIAREANLSLERWYT